VQEFVTQVAYRNQVLGQVATKVAPRLEVVNFEVRHAAARLTPPAVASQNLKPQLMVRCGIDKNPRFLWTNTAHRGAATSVKNSCFAWSGRSLYRCVKATRSAKGLPSCRCARARKSAEIISRQ
jgi:hypothetical protein